MHRLIKMAITSKTQVSLSKFNRLGNPNMRQIFSLRGKYLKKRSQVFDVSRATTDFNETKTGFLYVESSLFVLNSYHRTVGSIFFLLSPFLFHFTLTKGQGGQDDFFLFNPFSLLSCLYLRTVGPISSCYPLFFFILLLQQDNK